jgi:phage tail sheath protein FI
LLDEGAALAVLDGMVTHCHRTMDRLAIIDPPPGLGVQQIRDWRMTTSNVDSKFAALYWPYIEVSDPLSGKSITVPPSGHVAGIWGRNDTTRGVHKAPANETVLGALDLALNIANIEQGDLNEVGINCIRTFPGRGIRVWGARTLSSDAAWRYVNVRRLFNYLEESIIEGTSWVVFEPNDEALWARIRRTIGAFLTNEWRKGALSGATPLEAFYVKCDRETNPQDAVNRGEVTCMIGVAPSKPAEFVVFRLAQWDDGASLIEA